VQNIATLRLKAHTHGGHFVLRWVAILGAKVRGFSRGLDRSGWGKKAENPSSDSADIFTHGLTVVSNLCHWEVQAGTPEPVQCWLLFLGCVGTLKFRDVCQLVPGMPK